MSDSPKSHPVPPFTLRQLAYLVSAADLGTVAAAAAEHWVSPSVVSDAITSLETDLGATLCVRRKGRGLTLTPTGARFVTSARAFLRSADALAAGVSGHDGLAGPIRVGCYPTLAPVVLPVLLTEFAAAHPAVDLTTRELTHDRLDQALREGEVDVAFVYDKFVPGHPDSATLYRLPIHVLLAADHRLAGRGSVTLEELVDEDLILLDAPPSGDHTLSIFAERGLRPRIRHRTGSYEAVRALVAAGQGYAVQVQRPVTMADYAGTPLASVDLDPPAQPVGVAVVWDAAAEPPDRVRALIDFARGVDWQRVQPTALGI